MEQQPTNSETHFLQDLRSGLFFKRRDAAIELGKLTKSSDDVAFALLLAKESDTNDDVKTAAASAIEAPVHQQYIQDHPELIQKVKQVTQSLQTQRMREHRHESRVRISKRVTNIGLILFFVGICIQLSKDFITSGRSSDDVFLFLGMVEFSASCLGILLFFAGLILSVLAGGSKTQS